ncbi:MAG: MBL fold metallo-hydrolase [Holosporaceae bacterium]|nr:MBL fold metallo-hydrolase [Holosporaceae bacterium]
MKLTVLVDNEVKIGRSGLLAEHGLSYYIETNDVRMIFDVGESDVFIKNAEAMNVNLKNTTHIVLSHGHHDHTWGLCDWVRKISPKINSKPHLIAHEHVFDRKIRLSDLKENTYNEIGAILCRETLQYYFEMQLTKNSPIKITENLFFLGEIERTNDFENKEPLGKICQNGKLSADYCFDDSALIYHSANKGIVIISGCSHSGICNIAQYAQRVGREIWSEDRIFAIIGGLHLKNPSLLVLNKTAEFLKVKNIVDVYPCHCTDLESKIMLSKAGLNVKQAGVGFVFDFPE